MRVHPESILFVTLDSCRYDTFAKAHAPHMRAIGDLHRAMAPGNFTFSSHAAIFMGFTPGVPGAGVPYLDPKFAKIFKLTGAGIQSRGGEFVTLSGRSIIDGLRRIGYLAIGSAAMGWFNPQAATGVHLTQDFDEYLWAGNTWSVQRQVDFIWPLLAHNEDRRVFVFLNVGETHVPYYYDGAPWRREQNPCVPYSADNDAEECARRQQACLEYVDRQLAPLLEAFAEANVVLCADHGDAWGEDGLWEHGVHHEKVLEVPLIFQLRNAPGG